VKLHSDSGRRSLLHCIREYLIPSYFTALPVVLAVALTAGYVSAHSDDHDHHHDHHGHHDHHDDRISLKDGKYIFRYDTFGSEAFFSDVLMLHEPLNSVDPATALAVGLKVDIKKLPKEVIEALKAGEVDLNDPAVTRLLLQLDAVVGIRAKIEAEQITRVGITCALCHSEVDDSLTEGIGYRLDGWANRDLNVGTIIGLSPNLQAIADLLGVDVPTVQAVLASWGPGKFDAHLNLDGKGLRPDGKSGAVLIPPAFGLAGVNLATYTGWGTVSYWNAFVANLEMGGLGTFFDPRLDDAVKFPIAAANGFFDVRNEPDLITKKLPALHHYQLSLEAPRPSRWSYNRWAARRGQKLFNGRAECSTCHVPPLFTEPGYNLHTPEEIGIDDFQAMRSPTEKYRTTPLKGLWTHTKGGFYHDGRFEKLIDVVNHYDNHFSLNLSEREKYYIVEYLKSL